MSITAICVPAPVAPIIRFAQLVREAPLMLWQPRAGVALASSGAVTVVTARGPNPLPELRQRCASILDQVHHLQAGAANARPAMVGGLAFCPGADHGRRWQEFGDGMFLLPRWQYAVEGNAATLTYFAADLSDIEIRKQVAVESDVLIAGLHQPTMVGTDIMPNEVKIRHQPRREWTQLVDRARAAIAAGDFAKVVLARRSSLTGAAPLRPTEVFRRLWAANPDCFCFSFTSTRSTFAGASPERLVKRVGRTVYADALAGTSEAGEENAHGLHSQNAANLLASTKNRIEHGYVVQAIAQALRPVCSELSVPTEPQALSLRHLLHLHTPISGTLSKDIHVLDLVAALHPTPAVGGLPADAALDWLAKHEPNERGWYAGPIGWFDAQGDGEFAVAIRSALIEGHRAWVYAGSGIVAESDAEGEYEETTLKQRAMWQSLGILA
jgi:isochorismate synthase